MPILDDVLSLCHLEACDRQWLALLDRFRVHLSNCGANSPGPVDFAARDRAEARLLRETRRRERICEAMMERAQID